MLIPRENIILFGENLKLGINLRRTIVIEFYNSRFIQSLSRGFSLQVEMGFPHKYLCLVYFIFSHPTGFRNKVLFPTHCRSCMMSKLRMTDMVSWQASTGVNRGLYLV